MEKRNQAWIWVSIISFLCAFIFVCIGFHKMLAYENSEYSWGEHVNAYVGGDAYNYIINGTYSTAFFALATLFVVLGIGCAILYYLSFHTDEVSANIKTINENLRIGFKKEIAEENVRLKKEEAEWKATEEEILQAQREREQARQAKIDAYWEAHSQEKAALLEKRAEAEKKLAEMGGLATEQRKAIQELIASIDEELTKDREG